MPGLFRVTPRSGVVSPRAKRQSITQKTQRRQQQIDDASAGEAIVKGKIPVIGGGDAEADINFPVWFVEAPHMTFGGEVSGSVNLELGSFPVISALVGEWNVKELDGSQTRQTGRKFYIGARLLLSVDGSSDIVIHYQFTGLSITNPTGALTTFTTDTGI